MVKHKGQYMVWIDVEPEVEKEWNKWIDEKHLPEILKRGKFLAAHRYVVKEGQGPAKYLNVYDAESLKAVKKYREGPGKAISEDYMKRYGKTTKITRLVVKEIKCVEAPRQYK